MPPEPWPAPHHLPTIALAILMAAALVAATLIAVRVRLSMVRQADVNEARYQHLITSVASITTTTDAMAARIAYLEARVGQHR